MSATIAAKAKRKQKPRTNLRQPEEIMADFFKAQNGLADISIQDVLGEILEDVVDTVRLSIEYHLSPASSVDPADITIAVLHEVEDYIANYYADGTGEIAGELGGPGISFAELDEAPESEDDYADEPEDDF